MINHLLKQKGDFIERYLEKLFAGLNIPKEQIRDRMVIRVNPGMKEQYYLDGVLILEFNLKPTKDKVELIFKVTKI